MEHIGIDALVAALAAKVHRMTTIEDGATGALECTFTHQRHLQHLAKCVDEMTIVHGIFNES
jgi:hypothetical protein